jgi:hypothetical protein
VSPVAAHVVRTAPHGYVVPPVYNVLDASARSPRTGRFPSTDGLKLPYSRGAVQVANGKMFSTPREDSVHRAVSARPLEHIHVDHVQKGR